MKLIYILIPLIAACILPGAIDAQVPVSEIWLKRYNKDCWTRLDSNMHIVLYLNDSQHTIYEGYIKPLTRWSIQMCSKRKGVKHSDTISVKDVKMLKYQSRASKIAGTVVMTIGATMGASGITLAVEGAMEDNNRVGCGSSNTSGLKILTGAALTIIGLVPTAIGGAIRSHHTYRKMTKWEILIR